MIITIIAAVFVFGILVLFHEFGHFITAKMVGMRVDEFAIGFGPKLLSVKRGETVYSLRAIPLGGFNKIAGMDPEEEKDERSYSSKPIWARMLVILAGSFMNFVLPVMLFFGIFVFSGVSTPSPEPVLGEIMTDKAADKAGMQQGDRIVKVDGQEIKSWEAFVLSVKDSGGKILRVELSRGGEPLTVNLIPEYDAKAKRALIGVISSVETYRPGMGESLQMAVQNTGMILFKMVEGFWEMFSGKTEADLAGPLGVAQMAGDVAQLGIVPLLHFAAALSINLGVINLFPIPALDGGHFVTLCIEALRGKPLDEKHTQYAQMIGFMLLMGLMLFATMKDFSRFFGQ